MPSSWDGTACSCGAVCTSGTVTKGNNGSGPAPADAENATRPTVAPMATAARRELAENVEIKHRGPLFDCFERPKCAFAARCCQNEYLATVSGRLRERAKMVSSGSELFHRGGHCRLQSKKRPPKGEATAAAKSLPLRTWNNLPIGRAVLVEGILP